MTNVRYMPQAKYSKNPMANKIDGIIETISFTKAKMLFASCVKMNRMVEFQEHSYSVVQRMNILISQGLESIFKFS